MTKNVYQRLISSPSLTPEETLSLQKPMDDWYQSLPPYLKQATPTPEPDWLALVRNRLMWRDWNLRILLYRPILLRWAARRWSPNPSSEPEPDNPAERDCRLLCLQNARATIASISDFMDNHICTRLGAWYMVYVLLPISIALHWNTVILSIRPVHPSIQFYWLIQLPEQILPLPSRRNPNHLSHDGPHQPGRAVLAAGHRTDKETPLTPVAQQQQTRWPLPGRHQPPLLTGTRDQLRRAVRRAAAVRDAAARSATQ